MARRISLHGNAYGKSDRQSKQKNRVELNESLTALVSLMTEYSKGADFSNNVNLPAGYTYFGQFIAHDLTFHRRSLFDDLPGLNLDGVYGGGPLVSPHLYDYSLKGQEERLNGLLFELHEGAVDPPAGVALPQGISQDRSPIPFFDLPRKEPMRLTGHGGAAGGQEFSLPLMGDARNDENFLLAQLHVLFMRAHNRWVRELVAQEPKDIADKDFPGMKIFMLARKVNIRHYQHLVLYDYLPRLVDSEMIDQLINARIGDFVFFKPREKRQIKPFFTEAVMRIGHSQVRSQYKLHFQLPSAGIFKPLPTGGPHLTGFQRTNDRAIDWTFFFDFNVNKRMLQFSRDIDLKISSVMLDLPYPNDNPANLIERNLSATAGITINNNFSDEIIHLGSQEILPVLTVDSTNLMKLIHEIGPFNLPLWVFVLYEAQQRREHDPPGAKSKRFGPIGGRMMAEQLIWILRKTPESILGKNRLEAVDNGYQMTDFIKFAQGEINSIT